MNYLEFKRHFMQINSDKAFLFLKANWLLNYEVIVYGDIGTATDMEAKSNYNYPISYYSNNYIADISSMTIEQVSKLNTIKLIVDALIQTHESKDLVVVLANSFTIDILMEAVSSVDGETNLLSIISFDSDGDYGVAIDSNTAHNNIIRLISRGDKADTKELSSEHILSVGYNIGGLWANEIKDLLFSLSLVINYGVLGLDSTTASDLETQLSNSIEYSSDSELIETINEIAIELLSTIDYDTILDDAVAKDFSTSLTNITRIVSTLKVSSTFISDIKDYYLSDIAPYTLEYIMTNN